MIETNNPEIDAGTLQRKVREEMVRVRNQLRRVPQRGQEEKSFFMLRAPKLRMPKPRSEQEIGDDLLGYLLQFHNAEFVRMAYRTILGRRPDKESFDLWQERIIEGRYSKIDLIGRLRYSPEGKKANVRIKGLLLPFALQCAGRLPVIGYFIRLLLALVRLPGIQVNVRRLENHMISEIEGIKKNQNILIEKFNRLIASETLQDLVDLSERIGSIEKTFKDQQAELMGLLDRAQNAQSEDGGIVPEEVYVAFEKQFRGRPEEIKKRLQIYLPEVRQAVAESGNRRVLDLGCGRGEWLDLMAEEGMDAWGVDTNKAMVAHCRQRLLKVTAGDLFVALADLKDESMGLVTAFQLIEHLRFEELVRLIDETRRVLAPGGRAIFETPNPENLIVGACNFYADPTHKKPLFPPTLKFLARQRGFPTARLTRIRRQDLMPPVEENTLPPELIERVNALIRDNNRFFAAASDVALILEKQR